MNKVLLTGASGFVGNNLLNVLTLNDFIVIPLVRSLKSKQVFDDLGYKSVVIDWDKRNIVDFLHNFLIKEKINYLIHCAGAIKAISYLDYYKANFLTTKYLLKACVNLNYFKQFILISSQAAQGPSNDNSEDKYLPRPISDYGKTKLQAENLASQYKNHFPLTILRPCSIYGPRDTQFLSIFRMLKNNFIISISDYEQRFNLIYVLDFINVIISCMRNIKNSQGIFYVTDGNIYNSSIIYSCIADILAVSDFKTIKISKYFLLLGALFNTAFMKLFRKPILFNFQKVRELTQKSWLCNSDEITNNLSINFQYSIENGFRQTYEWYKLHNMI